VLKVLANHQTSKWWFVTAVYGSDVFAVGVDPNAATFATATSGHFQPDCSGRKCFILLFDRMIRTL
jgi:hypothetical protein